MLPASIAFLLVMVQELRNDGPFSPALSAVRILCTWYLVLSPEASICPTGTISWLHEMLLTVGQLRAWHRLCFCEIAMGALVALGYPAECKQSLVA